MFGKTGLSNSVADIESRLAALEEMVSDRDRIITQLITALRTCQKNLVGIAQHQDALCENVAEIIAVVNRRGEIPPLPAVGAEADDDWN